MTWSTFTEMVLAQSIATFGQAVTYTPTVGSPYSLRGIFDRPDGDIHLGHGAAFTELHPKLGVRLSDMAAKPAKGDRVTIGSETFRVIDSDEDGQGGSSLKLQKQ